MKKVETKLLYHLKGKEMKNTGAGEKESLKLDGNQEGMTRSKQEINEE